MQAEGNTQLDVPALASKRLHSYALLKAFVADGQDYLDAFSPFVLEAVGDNYSRPVDIQNRVENRHGIIIPLHVMRTLLGRLCQSEMVEKPRNSSRYRLTSQGSSHTVDESLEEDTQREINALFEDLREHLGKDSNLTQQDVRQKTLNLIQGQVDSFVQFLYWDENLPETDVDRAFSVQFIEYIQVAKDSKPTHYDMLRRLILGALLAWVIGSRSSDEITSVQDFTGCTLYLDTNIVFTLLGYREHETVQSGRELLELIRRYGFRLKVFDFTVDEVVSVVDAYLKSNNQLGASINVDSIFTQFRLLGWTVADVLEFKTNIDTTLAGLDIEIESTSVDLKSFVPAAPEKAVNMMQFKQGQAAYNRNHDLAALQKVEELRPHRVRRVNDSPAYFLTADRSLYRFDQTQARHGSNGTLGVAMLDHVLAGLLWLKDPQVELSIESLVTAHSRSLLVNRRVWTQFQSVFLRLREEGKLGESELTGFLYQGYLTKVLRELDEQAVESIDEDFVLEHAEHAAKSMEASLRTAESNAQQQIAHAQQQERERANRIINEVLESAYAEQQVSRLELEQERAEIIAQGKVDGYLEAQRQQEADNLELAKNARKLGETAGTRWVTFLRWYLFCIGVLAGYFIWSNGLLDLDQLSTSLTLLITLIACTIQPFLGRLWDAVQRYLVEQISVGRLQRLRRRDDLNKLRNYSAQNESDSGVKNQPA